MPGKGYRVIVSFVFAVLLAGCSRPGEHLSYTPAKKEQRLRLILHTEKHQDPQNMDFPPQHIALDTALRFTPDDAQDTGFDVNLDYLNFVDGPYQSFTSHERLKGMASIKPQLNQEGIKLTLADKTWAIEVDKDRALQGLDTRKRASVFHQLSELGQLPLYAPPVSLKKGAEFEQTLSQHPHLDTLGYKVVALDTRSVTLALSGHKGQDERLVGWIKYRLADGWPVDARLMIYKVLDEEDADYSVTRVALTEDLLMPDYHMRSNFFIKGPHGPLTWPVTPGDSLDEQEINEWKAAMRITPMATTQEGTLRANKDSLGLRMEAPDEYVFIEGMTLGGELSSAKPFPGFVLNGVRGQGKSLLIDLAPMGWGNPETRLKQVTELEGEISIVRPGSPQVLEVALDEGLTHVGKAPVKVRKLGPQHWHFRFAFAEKAASVYRVELLAGTDEVETFDEGFAFELDDYITFPDWAKRDGNVFLSRDMDGVFDIKVKPGVKRLKWGVTPSARQGIKVNFRRDR